ncbi:MAG: site-specific integrase, partial [Polyangiaceae bacterium]|nr:site-specific integrase [Polyangiaceae bacterium]
MAREARGSSKQTSDGWTCRVTWRGRERRTYLLPTCKTEREADQRAAVLAKMIASFRRAGVLETEDATKLVELAANADAGRLEGVLSVAASLAGGEELPPKVADAVGPTFAAVAGQWTSGELHARFPDHVPVKRSVDDDVSRFAYLCKVIGGVPIAAFRLEDAERAMANLPEQVKTSATRRQYAQLISKVLGLSVYPLRLIERSPIPRGWLPPVKNGKAFSYLYPSEDAALLAWSAVPLTDRVVYGFLAREGLRLGEALSLRWRDLDLERGAVRLDANKTDDPRAWALSPDVARTLAALKALEAEPDELVFPDVRENAIAVRFRGHLALAGVQRAELFERTEKRRPIRIHDLRATFVTLSLAAGKSEAWVSDRTGHRSSVMINRYRRTARHAAELGLGTLAPLDWALPELAGPAVDAVVAGLRALAVGNDCPPIAHAAENARSLNRGKAEQLRRVPRVGIEPTTRGFSRRQATAEPAQIQPNRDVEPTTTDEKRPS